ncbi:hypothetical protein CAMSH0001_1789 [Campylobacter showae RM3277]|uniref:Uncharacterized protein n=1 Tax=Campylobacter showae RM3277 TaxID=553219 RepID=C6RD73_9BACT|nr:hypothetical protein CAMSH0001_1789 [Campylobacter showae RM3277]
MLYVVAFKICFITYQAYAPPANFIRAQSRFAIPPLASFRSNLNCNFGRLFLRPCLKFDRLRV